MVKNSNEIIEAELTSRLQAVEGIVDADLVTYLGTIADSTPDIFKDMMERRASRRPGVAVFLETDGGFIEPAERIANILRHHYSTVVFIVTSYAMSAGTVLVMSGDSIWMDYSATLGPVDPQWRRPGSETFVPALGYLEAYDRLIQKSARGELTTAELAYLLQNFDAAELYQFEQARDLSIALMEEWLVTYKFKNWTVTETRGKSVTLTMKKRRATDVARQLNDTSRWHSHSRGISMDVLRRELKLQIDDVGDRAELQKALSDYRALLYDYRGKRGHYFFVSNWSEGYHGH